MNEQMEVTNIDGIQEHIPYTAILRVSERPDNPDICTITFWGEDESGPYPYDLTAVITPAAAVQELGGKGIKVTRVAGHFFTEEGADHVLRGGRVAGIERPQLEELARFVGIDPLPPSFEPGDSLAAAAKLAPA